MTAVDEMKAGMNQGEQGLSGLSVEGDAGIESINTSRSKRKAMDNETSPKPEDTNPSMSTDQLVQFLFSKNKGKSSITYDAKGNPELRVRSPSPVASSSKVTLEMLLEREAKAKAPSGEKSFNVEVTSKREGKARERAPPEDSQGKDSSEDGPDAKRSRLENEVPVVSVKDASALVPVKNVDGKEIVDEQALFNLMQSTASGAAVPASKNFITGDYIVGDNEDDDEDLRLAIMMSMQDGQGASGVGDEYLAAMLAAEESDPMEPMEFDIDAAQMLKEMIDSGLPIDDRTLSVLTELKERQDNVREAEAELARLAEVRKNNYAIKLALQEDRMKEEEALAKQMDAAIGKGKGRAVQL